MDHTQRPIYAVASDEQVRTTKGREVHGVRSFMNVDECRDRMILAECLVLLADDHPDCGDCLLANTPLDPRAAA